MEGETIRHPALRDFMQREFSRYMLREGMKGSQAAWARMMGVDAVSLGKYMMGVQLPGPKAQDKIAKYLGVGIYRACGATPKVPGDPELLEIVEGWTDLPRSERSAFVKEFKKSVQVARKKESDNRADLENGGVPNPE